MERPNANMIKAWAADSDTIIFYKDGARWFKVFGFSQDPDNCYFVCKAKHEISAREWLEGTPAKLFNVDGESDIPPYEEFNWSVDCVFMKGEYDIVTEPLIEDRFIWACEGVSSMLFGTEEDALADAKLKAPSRFMINVVKVYV